MKSIEITVRQPMEVDQVAAIFKIHLFKKLFKNTDVDVEVDTHFYSAPREFMNYDYMKFLLRSVQLLVELSNHMLAIVSF